VTAGRTKILIVGPSLRYLGGQAVQAGRLVDRLREIDAMQVEYLVVDPRLPAPLDQLQRLPIVRTLVTSLAYVISLLRRLPHADVVHIFSASYWSFLIAPTPALLLSRLFGRRVILNYHSGEADDHLTRWGWHAKPLLRLADLIVVPTDYLVGVFASHGFTAVAIANHLDADRIVPRDPAPMRPRFFSNRNFEAHYNVGATIDAFAAVQADFPDAELVIAGGGGLRATLESQVAARGLRQVRFTGPVPPAEMLRLYAEADVYVNASLIDNMPLSILEAYASGVPVITSDAGGIPWIASDGVTAAVVPAGDAVALADAMRSAVRDPESAWARAANARRFVVAEYSWTAVVERWMAAYTGASLSTPAAGAPR
jgi:L-malate glycosyltransferase